MKQTATNNKRRQMLTVGEVAQMLGISYAAALRRVESMPGALELRVPGKKQRKRMLRVPREAVETYLAGCTKAN